MNEGQLIQVNPASLIPHPDNYNIHPPEQIAELVNSLVDFSQVKNVVIWQGLILAGHGLVTAALEAGLPEIEARDVSHWTQEKAVAFMVADNETARLGHPDYARLQGLVEQAKAAGQRIPGMTAQRLAEIAREARRVGGVPDWDSAFGGLPDGDRSPFQQMTFTLHDSQAQRVQEALKTAQGQGVFTDSPNQNSNGNALAFICEVFLDGQG